MSRSAPWLIGCLSRCASCDTTGKYIPFTRWWILALLNLMPKRLIFTAHTKKKTRLSHYKDKKAVVIGSGPIRIGQGIEFDYCSVHSAWALQEAGIKSIMVNSNPETVSTDFDTSDRLYFEALDEESLRDILENENIASASNPVPPSIVQFGGQTAINLAEPWLAVACLYWLYC